ncbi:MAG TPA: TerC family protein [Dokdonella sp.]|uniref:TerC family protein n=1 Tax=Dokdonella sp. TaxID=2291710 RepID=UPI002D807E53|nr:TerC family protein [Dokdonella sp.]HET9032180.1 TerC family protein [Dokdonella sp.]
MLELLADPNFWIALFTLATLEIVLGIDNLVFVSIAVSRLAPEQRPLARKLGLSLACVTRIGLLLFLSFLAGLDDDRLGLFTLGDQIFSLRDLIMIGGGLFLLVKAVMEIHQELEGTRADIEEGHVFASFVLVILQIAVIDIVFSLDSVITAIGLVNEIVVMVAAIILAVAVMILASNPVGDFIDRHPTLRMLALAFLILVGVVLIADGLEFHVPRGYVYFAMGFSILVESLNQWARKRGRMN